MLVDDPITLQILEKHKDIGLKEKLRIEINETNKRWRENNHKKYNKCQNKYAIKRRKKDPKFNLDHRMKCAISASLKKNKKGQSWEMLVGYTLDNLIERLESTMPGNYTWQDFLQGKLHVDHIIPKSIFSYINPDDEEFKKCWALNNLQLLTAEDNMKKGNNI